MCIIIYTVYDPFRLYYEVYRLKDFSRTGARLFRITAAVLLILFLLLWGAQTLFAHRNPVFTPDYPMEDLTALLAQEQLSTADYDTLFLQTGLGTPAIDTLLAQGAQGREQILAIQRQFFAAPATVCAELFGLLVREDRLAPDENGQPVWGPPMPALEDGDVLLTYATHSMGWRHGHAGLVVDAAGQKVLEAVVIGSDAAVTNLGHWRSYSNYLVLRLREKSPELQSELTTWALEHLEGVPYRLFSGLLGPKAPDPGLPGFGVQCAHLIWYAFQQFSYDVDADGGRLVTVDDLARSPLFEVVQLYGLDPRQWIC